MIKKVRVEEAIGQALLHDITAILPSGFKGPIFKRGHIIESKDIEKLKDIGKEHIYVGQLEEGKVHEEDAALELAPYICGQNIDFTAPSEGKTNLISKRDGLLYINIEGLNKINGVGDYTIASKYNYSRIKRGQTLAGLRIVPLWTDREIVDQAIELAKAYRPIFKIKAFHSLKIGTIITGNEVYYGRIKDGFEPVLRAKFASYDCQLLGFTLCPDNKEEIKKALGAYLSQGADLVIFTGGMSVDPDDLTPSVIRESADNFIIQGLPIQPGNMLTLARLGQAYLVGLPGASLHAERTSFDTILPRIFAKEDLRREDLIILGEGGLY